MGGPFDRLAIVIFDQRSNRRAGVEALAHVERGGQSLHVWDPRTVPRRFASAPESLRSSVPWAHLMDRNLDRLVATARRLGVRRPIVARDRLRGQYIDIAGMALRRAVALSAIYAGYEDVVFEHAIESFAGRDVEVVDFRFANPTVVH